MTEPPPMKRSHDTCIALETSDKVTEYLPWYLAIQSSLLKNLISDMNDHDQFPTIPLPNIDHAMFLKIKEWLIHHQDDVIPANHDPYIDEYEEIEKLRKKSIDPWDRDYFTTNVSNIATIVVAANYLDIKPLLDLGVKLLAEEMDACKSDQEIREKFGFPDDLTPLEKEDIRKQFAWADMKTNKEEQEVDDNDNHNQDGSQ